MMSKSQQPVIIIKKNRHGKHGHHGGAWKVAYADFVTAMMAFFLVMWLINTSPQVRSPMASYFRDPGIFDHTSGGGAAPGASMGAQAGNADQPPVAAAKAALEDAAETIRRQLESLPDFSDIKTRVEMQMTSEGLRIEMLDDNSQDAFFEVGSSNVRPQLVDILKVITANVSKLPNKIAIEGHTDSRPYGPALNYSNWQLSSDRANAARQVMETEGMAATQLEALHAYGSARLRYPEQPLDPRNRRIAIVVRGS
jgi:chemotaxis protein MotB